MDISVSTAVTLTLTNLDKLDTVTVYLEDMSPRQGRIVIHCWGKAWAAFWPAMGSRGIAKFYIESDNAYLAKNLASDLKSEVNDYEALHSLLLDKVTQKLSNSMLSEDDTHYFQSVKDALIADKNSFYDDREGEFWCHSNTEYLYSLIGEEWWNEIPQKLNHEYQYLCRIIDAVREGLKGYIKTKTDDAPSTIS